MTRIIHRARGARGALLASLLGVALAALAGTASAQSVPTEPTACAIRTVTATDGLGNPYTITLTMCPKVEEFGP